MKTLGRILIILLVAAVVIGGTYALLQTSAGQALVGQPMGQTGLDGQARPPDFANGQNGMTNMERGGDHEGGSGTWETMVRNLFEMALIVAAVQVVWTIGRKIKRLAEKSQRLQVSRSS
jgi:hypothetical protein